MNVHNFKRVMKAISEAPAKDFTMSAWHCGTAHCIAGWCEVVTHHSDDWHSCGLTAARARAFLGIDRAQARRLFNLIFWPDSFRRDYYLANREPLALQSVALARMKHFIETGGRE